MFCRSCGVALPANAEFCSSCGASAQLETKVTTQSPEVQAQNRKSRATRPSFVIAFVVFLGLFLLWNRSRDQGQQQAPVQTSSATEPAPKHRIGETFSVGYWSYRCNGARWQPALYSGYDHFERPDAAFLLVDLWIRNDDRTASTLPPFKLLDAQGREYEESSKALLMEGSFDPLKDLNPSVSSHGYAVFDVPQGEYALEVSGGFKSQESALVELWSEPKQQPSQEPTQTPSPQATTVPGGSSEGSEQISEKVVGTVSSILVASELRGSTETCVQGQPCWYYIGFEPTTAPRWSLNWYGPNPLLRVGQCIEATVLRSTLEFQNEAQTKQHLPMLLSYEALADAECSPTPATSQQ